MLPGRILQKISKYRYVVQIQTMGTIETVPCWSLSTNDTFSVGEYCSVLTHASDPRLSVYVITKGVYPGHGEIVASPASLSPWNWLNNILHLGQVQVNKPKYWFGIIDKLSTDRTRADVQLYLSGNFAETASKKILPFNRRYWTDVPIQYFGDSGFFSFETGDHVVLDFNFSSSPRLIGFAQEPRLREVIGKTFYQHIIPIGQFKSLSGVIDDKPKYDKNGNLIDRDPLDGTFYAFAPINQGYKYSGSTKIYDLRTCSIEMLTNNKSYYWKGDRIMETTLRSARTLFTESFLLNTGRDSNNIHDYIIWKRDGTYERRYLARSFNTVFGGDFESNYGSDYKTGVRYTALPFIETFEELKGKENEWDVIFHHRGTGRILNDITGWFTAAKYSPVLNLEGYLVRKQDNE